MVRRVWILGASDPEMEEIERVLADAGEWYGYATHGGNRVHPGAAYRADGVMGRDGELMELPSCSEAIAVECGGPAIPDGARVVDHHRDGDPGFDGVPSRYYLASSLGQVCAILARAGVIGHLEEGTMDTVPVAPRGLGPRFEEWPNGQYALCHCGRVRRQSPASPDGMRPAGRSYETGETWRYWYVIPHEHLLVAAADHCLAAAYRGECPGVDPDALGRWRAESRAVFQRRPVEAVLSDIRRAKARLMAAPITEWGGRGCYHLLPEGERPEGWLYSHDSPNPDCPECEQPYHVRDLRGIEPPIPELPEAGAQLGVAYVSGPLVGHDGRAKFCVTGQFELIASFLRGEGPGEGIFDRYGSPERGFAGGYIPYGDGKERSK